MTDLRTRIIYEISWGMTVAEIEENNSFIERETKKVFMSLMEILSIVKESL
jgi:hypothetical protein